MKKLKKPRQQKPFTSTKQKFFFPEEKKKKKKAILVNFWGFLIPCVFIFSFSNSGIIRACAMYAKSVEWDPLKYIAKYTIIFYCQLFFPLCFQKIRWWKSDECTTFAGSKKAPTVEAKLCEIPPIAAGYSQVSFLQVLKQESAARFIVCHLHWNLILNISCRCWSKVTVGITQVIDFVHFRLFWAKEYHAIKLIQFCKLSF